MPLTLPLILAHFLADFVFQPRILVQYKQRRFFGVVVHTLIHAGVSAIAVFPFLNRGDVWIGIGLIFITHTLFDQLKIQFNKVANSNKWLAYCLDQVVHLSVIALIAEKAIGPVSLEEITATSLLYQTPSFWLFLITLTLTTYFYDVTRWTYRNTKEPQAYKRDYQMMIRNAIVVSIAFGLAWVLPV